MAFCMYILVPLGAMILLHFKQVGTCAMKPRDKGGVVDERLNVYGVQGLKVAGTQIVLISSYST